MNFWNNVWSIVVALGIIEAVRMVFLDHIRNNYIQRKKELKQMGNWVLRYAAKLRQSNFQKPPSGKEVERLYRHVMKMKRFDSSFANDMMQMINGVQVLIVDLKNAEKQQGLERNIINLRNELFELTDKVVDRCNEYRNPSLLNVKGVVNKIKMWWQSPKYLKNKRANSGNKH